MPTHRSYWQIKAGVPGEIRNVETPTKLADDEVLVKVHAWGLNPCDHMVADLPLPFIKYPVILGEDIAGVVQAVGAQAASKFKAGDRVTAVALGASKFKSEHGAFQEHTVVNQVLACKIPDSLSFTDAATLPLGVSTAASGLYGKAYLALPFPELSAVSTGKTILIWGASSAVGLNAIQLSKASGLNVIATGSPRNFSLIQSVGASQVFDYKSPTVIDDVVAALDRLDVAGIFSAVGSPELPIAVAAKSRQKPTVASTNPVPEGGVPEGVTVAMMLPTGGDIPWIETVKATFDGYLPEALAAGAYKVAPPVEVVPTKGLEGIPVGLDVLRKGVSAKKVAIEAV